MSKETQLSCTSLREYCSIDREKPKAPGGFELRTFWTLGALLRLLHQYHCPNVISRMKLFSSTSLTFGWSNNCLLCCRPESRHGHRRSVHQLPARAGRRLHHAVPGSRWGRTFLWQQWNSITHLQIVKMALLIPDEKGLIFLSQNTSYWCKMQ